MLQKIDQTPNGDAVEVIRCKDCIMFRTSFHWVTKEFVGHWCYMTNIDVAEDEFCSKAIRRTNCTK